MASLALYGAEFNPFAFPRTERSIAMEYYGLRGAEALSPTERRLFSAPVWAGITINRRLTAS